jgi:glyoxalase family protein
MNPIGLHHVTAIASEPQRNLDFYVGLLGLRLVKRTVNFDDPGSYHFYFGDAVGTPGTILTFFPWPNARQGRRGVGEVDATAFATPAGSEDYWLERLKAHRVAAELATGRFDEPVIRFADPDGMVVELIAGASPAVTNWNDGPIPAAQAVRGLQGVTLALAHLEPTAKLLTDVLGYEIIREQSDSLRLRAPGESAPGKLIDLLRVANGRRGITAAGSVHHIAFRAPDEATQIAWRERLVALGYGVSPVMDRTYFRSIYFREPGGVLFEIATDGPGFTHDESAAELGAHLHLPSWMESARSRIETVLPPITLPAIAHA